MAHDKHKGGIGFYVFVLMVLAVITYIEFAIVEYDISWLNRGWTMALLAILSVVKFFMVIWFFMHLKDDNKTYTGFFSSGMVIAMGTFIALAALFTVRGAMNVRAQQQEVVAEHGSEEHAAEIPERAFSDTLRVPEPKNQGLTVELPRATTETFSLNTVPAFGLISDSAATEETSGEEAPANESVTPEVEPESAAPDDETESSSTEETTQETATESSDEAVTQEATTTDDSSTEETTTNAEEVAETSVEEDTTSETASASDATEAATLSAQTDVSWDTRLGEQAYSNCVACHQPNGQGIPGAFPPQAGHAPEIYNVAGGRTYMIHTVLWGLQGEISVDGQTYNGIMTPWGSLMDDEQIAAVLNYVLTSWGNDALLEDFTPITPEEVAAERENSMTAQEVYDSRAALGIPE
jgi:mono/diheme cytochrome c family protein/heme/copper-type cytochrome/quinol oxidase subunit 4